MDRDRKLMCVFGQKRHHGCEILGVRKDHLAVVAALNDVVRVAGKRETGQAGYGEVLNKETRAILIGI